MEPNERSPDSAVVHTAAAGSTGAQGASSADVDANAGAGAGAGEHSNTGTEAHRDGGTRRIHRLLGNYSHDHQNPTNRLIHWLCVPPIVWSVMAALWAIPVPETIGRPGLWAFIGVFVAWVWYWRQSRPIGFAMLAVFAVFGLVCHLLLVNIGTRGLLIAAAAVFVIAWVGQFIGHRIEGRRPSFLTDLTYLLIGPAWLAQKALRKFGIAI